MKTTKEKDCFVIGVIVGAILFAVLQIVFTLTDSTELPSNETKSILEYTINN